MCILCQQTSPKRWFENMNMTSTGVREGILLGGAEKICPENNNLP